jgi:[protein-PII] uridylyltransferase
MKPVLANLLQLLWDSGLKVGHSFRTVGDCITSALDDGHLRTALVNTRLLAGQQGPTQLSGRRSGKGSAPAGRVVHNAVIRDREARYRRFGATACLQEPNVKETAGGLRDFHTALWLIYAGTDTRGWTKRALTTWFPESEARKACEAMIFCGAFATLRTSLPDEKTETLSLDLQTILAGQYGYKSGAHQLGSEKLMRDYYRHARELNLFLEAVSRATADSETRLARSWLKRSNEKLHEPFAIREDACNLTVNPSSLAGIRWRFLMPSLWLRPPGFRSTTGCTRLSCKFAVDRPGIPDLC